MRNRGTRLSASARLSTLGIMQVLESCRCWNHAGVGIMQVLESCTCCARCQWRGVPKDLWPKSTPADYFGVTPAGGGTRPSEGIVAQAGEEHIFVPLLRPSDSAKVVFLGEGILQPARQPAEGTLIDIVPEAHRGLAYQMVVAGAGACTKEFGIAPSVHEGRIAPAESCVRGADARASELRILEFLAGIGVDV